MNTNLLTKHCDAFTETRIYTMCHENPKGEAPGKVQRKLFLEGHDCVKCQGQKFAIKCKIKVLLADLIAGYPIIALK